MATGFPDWLRAFALLGKYGTEYKVVAVDEDGTLYAVLQGEYEGELQTIMLDDEGRITAFIIDSIDAWGNLLSIGNAELAARLGSPITFERSGSTQLMETFECGTQRWNFATSGADPEYGLAVAVSSHGGYALRLVGGSTADYYCLAQMKQHMVHQGKIGMSCKFCIPGACESTCMYLILYDGANVHEARVRYRAVAHKLDIYDGLTGWTEVADALGMASEDWAWNQWKFVIDPATYHYVRVLFNNQLVDVSDHTYYHTGNLAGSKMWVKIYVYSRDGENDVLYVDDVILTAAES